MLLVAKIIGNRKNSELLALAYGIRSEYNPHRGVALFETTEQTGRSGNYQFEPTRGYEFPLRVLRCSPQMDQGNAGIVSQIHSTCFPCKYRHRYSTIWLTR